jgi:hypothetical protein
MATMKLIRAGIPAKMITFGQYRVGDFAFADFANSVMSVDTYRVVHEKDYVPHAPLRALGYRHIGTEMFEESDGSVR